MSDERYPPDDPREWLRIARGDACLARADMPGVPPELLCFHAQQAAEKAIKAVLVRRGIPFPRTHDLDRLFELLDEQEVVVPPEIRAAVDLTQYAVTSRYPLPGPLTTPDELIEALERADAVLRWAEQCVGNRPESAPSDANAAT